MNIKVQALGILPVIINEFMANPVGSDTDYEWIELYNHSDQNVNLKGWQLDGKTFGEVEMMPNSFLIIARNKNMLLALYPDLTNVYELSISLKNSNDSIIFTDGTNSEELFYTNTSEGISWERVNFCSLDIKLHQTGNSIERVNDNYNVTYCESKFEGQLLISRNNSDFSDNFSAFVKDKITVKLDSNENIKEIEWTLHGEIQNIGYETQIEFDHSGSYKIETRITDENDNVFILQKDIIIFPHIIFNEVMPNPIGTDAGAEWIELYSDEGFINLDNWLLKDKNSSASFTISGDNYYILYPKLTLNNSDEELYLYTPTGLLSDSYSYKITLEGQSFSRNELNEWVDDYDITPGNKNHPKTTSEIDDENSEIDIINIRDAKELPLESIIRISGIVISLKNQLGKNTFYVKDETAGIKVYLSSTISEQININLGEKLILIGKLKESRGEFQIYINSQNNISKESSNNNTPLLNLNNDFELLEGSLIKLSGTISNLSGSSFFVSTNLGDIKITILSSTGIKSIKKNKGDNVEIIGILSQYGYDLHNKPNYRILPRFNSDIKIIKKMKIIHSDNITYTSTINGKNISKNIELKLAKNYAKLDTNKNEEPELQTEQIMQSFFFPAFFFVLSSYAGKEIYTKRKELNQVVYTKNP